MMVVGVGLFESCRDMMNIGAVWKGCRVMFTIIFLALAQIIVENEILDALLFLPGLPALFDHSNGEVGVRRKLQRPCLGIISKSNVYAKNNHIKSIPAGDCPSS